MGFFAVVAFCTTISSGELGPVPPHQCVWLQENYEFRTETACEISVDGLINSGTVAGADQMLEQEYGFEGKFNYFSYCIDADELKDFFRHFGVGDLGDIPENI